MEPVLIIVIVAVVLLGATAAFVIPHRKGKGPELEPPATAKRGSTAVLERPIAPAAEEETLGEQMDAGLDALIERELEAEDEQELRAAEGIAVLEPEVTEPGLPEPEVLGQAAVPRPAGQGPLAAVGLRGFGALPVDASTTRRGTSSRRRSSGPTSASSATTALLDDLRAPGEGARASRRPTSCVDALKDDLKKRLGRRPTAACASSRARPTCGCSSGVNGVGKTTTIGKVGHQQVADGPIGVMAAGDTFRAAAAEQLRAVGRAGRRRARAGQRGRRPRRGRLRRRRAGRRPRTSTWCWPTPPAACTPRSTSWRS